MKKAYVVFYGILAMFFHANLFAQTIEKIWIDKADSIYGFYSVIKPIDARVQGVLVLLDGYGGDAAGLLTETKLHNVACINNILTVCIPTGQRLFMDEPMKRKMDGIFTQLINTYAVKKNQFALGGFSSGGTIVLQYAEGCYENPGAFPILPRAIFTGDSPVDLLALYQSSKRDLKKNTHAWWLSECQMIIDQLDNQLGTPAAGLENYRKVSPFLESDTMPGREQFLQKVAYRTYHDVDINWYIQNRQRSIYETNMLNASELIARLVLRGNNEAEFVSSKMPGKRSNGQRHPHSWSIIDEVDLVQWIKEKLNFYPEHIAHPYAYNAPAGWTHEMIIFPIDFAPAVSYKGFEDLRFAPGWGVDGPEKWSYTFLWWLDEQYTIDEASLQRDLDNYYTGLTHHRAVADRLDLSRYLAAKAEVKKSATLNNDIATYHATVNIFDAQVTKKPGVLYIKIHVKKCNPSHPVLMFEVSGLNFQQATWKDLDKISEDFRCND